MWKHHDKVSVHYTHDAEKPCQHIRKQNRSGHTTRPCIIQQVPTTTWNTTMIGTYTREAIMLTDDRERWLKNWGFAPWRHTDIQVHRQNRHNNPWRRTWDTRELAPYNSIINPWKTCVNSENAKQRELISTTTGTEMQGKTNWALTMPEEFSKFSETCETDGNEFSLFCIQND